MENHSPAMKSGYLNGLLNFEEPGDAILWFRRTMAASIFITGAAWWQFRALALELGISLSGSWKWTAALAFGVVLLLGEILILLVTWTRFADPLLDSFARFRKALQRFRWLNLVVYVILLFPIPIVLMGSGGVYFIDFALRFFLLWMIANIGAVFLVAYLPKRSWFEVLGLTLLLYTIAYRFALFIPDISSFPFSLGYSEGSRYYYASLFLPGKVYGRADLSPPSLHPSRYLLQAIPFLFDGASVVWHRGWQVLLWVGTSFLAGFVLVRKISIPDRFIGLMWLAWGVLYILQGPVYYHLLVMVILVLWGVRTDRFAQTLFVVVAASVWAGISRVNWIPVPGLLAGTLYILGEKQDGRNSWGYFRSPLIWLAVGTIVGLITQQVYGAIAPSGTDWLTSIQNSPLLFYRLLPNPTFEAGVLLAALFGAAPLLFVFIRAISRRPISWNALRVSSLLVILVLLFLGGLLVSSKIGGGDDLHNMDAFFVHLMVIGSYVIFRRFVPDAVRESSQPTTNWLAFSWVLIVPMVFAMGRGRPQTAPDMDRAGLALERIQEAVDETVQSGGKVLFISQRHLLSFNLIDGVELLPEYEKTFLMEMAMSGNEDYFEIFDADLENAEYALIVTEKQNKVYKGREYVFGDEDNAWVKHVSVPLLEWYKAVEILDLGQGRIALMKPIRGSE